MKKLISAMICAALLGAMLSVTALAAATKVLTVYTSVPVTMYSQPSTSSAPVCTIPRSEVVASYQTQQNGFDYCAYKGAYIGWIPSNCLSGVVSDAYGKGAEVVTVIIVEGGDEGTVHFGPASDPQLKNYTIYNGRNYAAVYNFREYLALNPDLAPLYAGNPAGAITHFVLYGMKEGRQASVNWNLADYKAAHPELVAKYGDNNVAYYLIACGIPFQESNQ